MTPAAARGGTLPRPVRGAGARLFRLLVLGSMACGLAACVEFDGTLKPDGSGTFTSTYALRPKATTDGEKARYTSAHVTVDSFTIGKNNQATVKGHFDDVTKINTVEAFKNVTVTRTPEGANERISVKVTNPTPKELKDENNPGPKLTFHLPGTVKEANYDGKVSGDTVSWSFTLADWAKRAATEVSALYTPTAASKDAAAKDAGKDAAAKDGDAKKSAPAATKKKH